MDKFASKLRIPNILQLDERGSPGSLNGIYLERIKDCVAIINRISNRREQFCSNRPFSEIWSDEFREELRFGLLEDTFSFVTFFFLLVGFHRGIWKRTEKGLNRLKMEPGTLPEFPPEEGLIRSLRIIRNKMVAHTAELEPRNDPFANQIAYLEWYVGYHGLHDDLHNRRLNCMSVSVGNEASTHEIPPTFREMLGAAQSYLRLCERCLFESTEMLAEAIRKIKPLDYMLAGELTAED